MCREVEVGLTECTRSLSGWGWYLPLVKRPWEKTLLSSKVGLQLQVVRQSTRTIPLIRLDLGYKGLSWSANMLMPYSWVPWDVLFCDFSYPEPTPTRLDFINPLESTGSKHTAAFWLCEGQASLRTYCVLGSVCVCRRYAGGMRTNRPCMHLYKVKWQTQVNKTFFRIVIKTTFGIAAEIEKESYREET